MSEMPFDEEQVQEWFSAGFDKSMVGMKFVAWTGGNATVKLEVVPEVANLSGNLHGGAIATLIDDVGTLAIMGGDADNRPGVTTDLNVSYMSSARLGSTVLAEARALKCGRTLAFAEVEIKTEEGKPIAHGRLTKFMGHS